MINILSYAAHKVRHWHIMVLCCYDNDSTQAILHTHFNLTGRQPRSFKCLVTLNDLGKHKITQAAKFIIFKLIILISFSTKLH